MLSEGRVRVGVSSKGTVYVISVDPPFKQLYPFKLSLRKAWCLHRSELRIFAAESEVYCQNSTLPCVAPGMQLLDLLSPKITSRVPLRADTALI